MLALMLVSLVMMNVGRFANVQFSNVLRRYLAWQWIKERIIIMRFVYTLAKLWFLSSSDLPFFGDD